MTVIILLIAATLIGLLAIIFRQHKEIEKLDDELNVTLANLTYFKQRVEQMRLTNEHDWQRIKALYDKAGNIPKDHPQKRPKSMTAKTVRRKKPE